MEQIDVMQVYVDTMSKNQSIHYYDQTEQKQTAGNMLEVIDRRRVLAAKLSLPHQGFVLGRPRLRALIEPARPGGLVSVVAGPGCGKTAFIVDLLSSTDSRGVYYAVDEGDRDPIRFLRCLLAGIGAETPEHIVDSALEWPDIETPQNVVLEMVGHLMEHMSARRDIQTLVALDDVHLVDGTAEVMHALGLVVRGLPPRWTMLLTSRRPIPLDLSCVDLGGRWIKIQGRELRLTPREVAAWALKNWEVNLEPSEGRALWRLTEGWPAALALLSQHLLSGGGGIKRKDLSGIIARARDLRAYLEAQVFSDMEPRVAEVVMAAGLLPRVVFPRDEAFLPGDPGEAESILETFVSRGFLVTSSGRRGFTLHPLLRRYCERESRPEQSRGGLVEKAADHLADHGEDYHAAHLYLRCRSWDKASGPIRRLALASLSAVVDFAGDEWTELIPESAIEDRPWLMVVKARLLQQRREYTQATSYYESAAALLSAAGDREGLLLALLGSAFCLFSRGLWEQTHAILGRCATLAGTAREKAEVLVSEGSVLVGLSRWDEAVDNWEKALALTPPAERPQLAARIYFHRARLFHTLGHHRAGRQWADRALSTCRRAASPLRALALSELAGLESATGDYRSAEAHASECLELTRAKGYGFVEISALLDHAAALQGNGDYRHALARINQAKALAEKAGGVEELFRVENMLGDLCRRNRNPRRAFEHHRRALDIVGQNRFAEIDRVRASTGLGIDLVLLGRVDEGRAALEEAARQSRRLGLMGSLVPALLYLGWLNSREGREYEASRALAEGMRLAADHQHIDFLHQEARLIVPILALCDRFDTGAFVRERILPTLPGRLQEYFHGLSRGPTYPTDVPLGPPRRPARMWTTGHPQAEDTVTPEMLRGVDSLTDREREVLRLISQGMPNKIIAGRLFITEKTVKTHANHVFRKLGVSSRVQAALVYQGHHRSRNTRNRCRSEQGKVPCGI